jgi:PAS domain S-box-containing protein
MKIINGKKKKTKQFSEENLGFKTKEKVFGESEEKLKSIFAGTNDGIVFLDKFGKILDINKKTAEIFGGSEKELVGKHFTKTGLFSIKELPVLIRNFANALAGKKAYLDVSFKNKKGQQITLECSTSLIKISGSIRILSIMRDVTERKQAEAMLKESEEKFRVIFNYANDGMLLADKETKKFYTGNNTICQMLGYSLEEIKKLGITDIHPKEDLPYVIEQFERQTRREIAVAKDIPVKRKDGSVFYADVNSSVIILSGRTYLLGIFRDTTKRKQVEEELKTEKMKLESYIEGMSDGVVILNLKGRIINVNKAYSRMFRREKSVVVGKSAFSIGDLPKKEFLGAFSMIKEIIQKGSIENRELTLLNSEKKEVPILFSAALIKDSRGKSESIFTVFKDVTKRNKADKALQEEKNKLEKYFNVTGAIITFLSLDGKILLINRIGCETLGYKMSDIMNKNWADKFLLEKDRIKATAIFDSIIREKTDKIKYFETTFLAKNGKYITISWGGVIIKDESGKSQAILNIGINTTELAEAKIAINQLKELNKLKDDFLNIAAHELRTPLTSIIGFSDMLKERSHSLNSKQQKYINIINAESLRLNNIIKRILTITRFESGREIIRVELFNLATLIQSFRPSLDILLRDKKARLVTNIEKNDIVIRSNKEKILEIIYNFVDNSLKYGSEEQTITISITQPEKERVKIAVKDQGPGIPPEKIDRLFNKFSQLEPSLDRSQEGTGLGLYICKLIVDSLGGEIGVESTLGEGSAFYFTLPIQNSAT